MPLSRKHLRRSHWRPHGNGALGAACRLFKELLPFWGVSGRKSIERTSREGCRTRQKVTGVLFSAQSSMNRFAVLALTRRLLAALLVCSLLVLPVRATEEPV